MSDVKGWKTSTLGSIASITMGQSPDSIYYSDYEVGKPFIQGCSEFQSRTPKAKLYCSQERKVAETGEILFSVRAPVGKINIADQAYIIGRGLCAISARDLDHTYLEYILKFNELNFRAASQGSTFEAINSSELLSWPIAHPDSRDEQREIANVLSSVDQSITRSETLIEKQKKIKTGLMQDLLTFGIDDAGNIRSKKTHEFRDTPLGMYPVEWDVKPAYKICEAVIDCKNRTPPVKKSGHPVIRTPNVRNGGFVYKDLVFTDHDSYNVWTERGKPRAGDVVITREAPFGEACKIPSNMPNACLGQRMMMYQPDTSKISNDFLVHIINSERVQHQLLVLAGGSTVGHVRVGDIKELLIPHPTSLSEQVKINALLNNIDLSISQLKESYLKLKKQKNGLMQDLLTGKVRVTELLDQPH